MIKVHEPKKGKYIRIRVRNPKSFKKDSFRTHDIGRKGHSKRIAGKLKSGKWATQAFLVSKSDRHMVPDFVNQAKRLVAKTKRKRRRKH
jgi:hypothetical protein